MKVTVLYNVIITISASCSDYRMISPFIKFCNQQLLPCVVDMMKVTVLDYIIIAISVSFKYDFSFHQMLQSAITSLCSRYHETYSYILY